MYNKSLLAISILNAFLANIATAEEANSEQNASDIEIISVTGTRGSLTRALATKRETMGVVDSIAAEDLGQFPDQNVAESLQRVSGVSIDRSGGEGRSITVRGLGPEFNTVLLNGRLLATDNPGREFSFDILPSELISGADVYKSSAADFQEGGIGSTVIIRTARPTDRAGLVITGNLGGKYDSGSEQTTPTGSLLVSNSNDEQTFGTLLSLVYDKRNTQIQRYTSDGWLVNKNLDFDNDGTADLMNVAVPRSFNQQVDTSSRERIGGTLALDWRINDDLQLKLDALYTQYDIDSTINTLAYFTDEGDIIDATVTASNTVNYFQRSDSGRLATDWVVDSNPRSADTMQLAANLQWYISDSTELKFDLSHSKATSKGKDTPFFVLGSRNTGLSPIWEHRLSGKTPVMSGVRETTDNSDLRAHFGFKRGNDVTDTINQLAIDAVTSFSAGSLKNIKYGVLVTAREKQNKNYQTPDSILCFYCGYFASVPAAMTQTFSVDNFLGQADLANEWLTFNPEHLIDYYISDAAIAQKNNAAEEANYRQAIADNGGNWNGALRPSSSGVVAETSWAAYIQGNWEGELNDMYWDLSAGLRYVATDVTSKGSSVQLLELNTIAGDATAVVPVYSDLVPVSIATDYSYLLPSMTFRLNLDEDIVLRTAASRTLTRPTLTNLSTAQSWNIRPPSDFTVSSGNPNLEPYLAWNADLGLDYFINDVSYASVALYYKSIENFVSLVTQPREILGRTFQNTQPTNAEKANINGIEASFQYTFDFLPEPWNGLGFSANYTKVNSSVEFDPTLSTQVFNVEGLSDSANFVAFLETDDFQFRAAYNWRDTFLLRTFGAQGQPESVNDYGQVDLTTSYQLTEQFTAYVNVLNLTNETQRSFQAYNDRLLALEDTGRRITFGVRAVF